MQKWAYIIYQVSGTGKTQIQGNLINIFLMPALFHDPVGVNWLLLTKYRPKFENVIFLLQKML